MIRMGSVMKFEWNRQKAISNFKKHQIDFEEAVSIFRDPFAKIFNDVWHSENEHRELIIGYSYKHRLLIVSFIERDENVVRIVSARKTTARERLDYEENQRQ